MTNFASILILVKIPSKIVMPSRNPMGMEPLIGQLPFNCNKEPEYLINAYLSMTHSIRTVILDFYLLLYAQHLEELNK